MDALSTWLRELGLERYGAVFAENDVDLDPLRLLTDGDLEKLRLVGSGLWGQVCDIAI